MKSFILLLGCAFFFLAIPSMIEERSYNQCVRDAYYSFEYCEQLR